VLDTEWMEAGLETMSDFKVPSYMQKSEIDKLMYTEEDIAKRVKDIASEISKSYSNLEKPLIVIATLKGATVFFAVGSGDTYMRCTRACAVLFLPKTPKFRGPKGHAWSWSHPTFVATSFALILYMAAPNSFNRCFTRT
jgi:hypothetical protein